MVLAKGKSLLDEDGVGHAFACSLLRQRVTM